MLPLALAVAAGTLAARFFPALSDYVSVAALLFVAALALFCLRRPEPPAPVPAETLRHTPPEYLPHLIPVPGFIARRGVNAFFIILCFGCFVLAAWRQGEWRGRLDSARLPLREWFTAVLVADAPAEAGRWNIPARVTVTNGAPAAGEIPVRLYASAKQSIRRGDLIRARIRLSEPRPPAFPGAFDSPFWLERDGLAAYANVSYRRNGANENTLVVIPAENVSLLTRARRVVDTVRAAAIRQTLEYGGAHGPMLAAMLYGHRADLDRLTNETFRRVGIGHVLAISGLHVGLVVGLLWWVSGLLTGAGRVRSVVCLVAAVVYLGLSGGQVAAARATLMAVIHLGARATGRHGDMLNSLGAAAFLIILNNPTAPLDIGFQLSFTAVVFIDIALRAGRGKSEDPEEFYARLELPVARRFLLRLRAAIVSLTRLSVSTSAGLYPIVAAVFHQVNLIGLPINIVVIPMMGAVLAGGLLLPVLGAIPGAAALLTLPSEALTRIAFAADAVPYSSFSVHSPSGWWIAAFYICVFCCLLHRMIISPAARRRWAGGCAAAAVLALAGMTAGMTSLPPPAEPRLAHLPGSGFGVVSAEMPDGAIALIGRIRRQGLNETAWLHHLRRSGPVSLVTIGRGKRDTLDALEFHYRPVAEENFPLTRKRGANAPPVWTPVPAVPGVEFALMRNSRGRAVRLLVRAGGKMITATPETAEMSGGGSVQPLVAEVEQHVGEDEEQVDRVENDNVTDVPARELRRDAAGVAEGDDDEE